MSVFCSQWRQNMGMNMLPPPTLPQVLQLEKLQNVREDLDGKSTQTYCLTRSSWKRCKNTSEAKR